MESRKSCRPLAAAASLFNLWFINKSSLQIVQPCGQLIDVIVAALSFVGFYTLWMSIFALYYWCNGKEFK